MKTATINIPTLKAINLAASTEEIRYYLCGVNVTVATNTVTYVATDGHVLLYRRLDTAEPNTLLGSWIIPLEWSKKLKIPRSLPDADMSLTDDGFLRFSGPLDDLARPVEGTFPEYERVIPGSSPEDTGAAQFGGAYLAMFAKFAKLLDIGTPHVHHAGKRSPAAVTFSAAPPGTFGVIMPIHGGDDSVMWSRELAELSPAELGRATK